MRDLYERIDSRVIVGALVHVGHDLGLHVVAEGVENEQHLALLEMMGCPCAQGHLFAGALPAEELVARLRAETGLTAEESTA